MDAVVEAAENTIVMKLRPRIRRWIYARSEDTSGSSLKFSKSETIEAVSKILKYAKEKEKGTFTPCREKDELSLRLGNPEHTGRVRGLGKLTIWKHGFLEEQHMYKKYSRGRASELELQVKALVDKALEVRELSTKPQTLMGPPGELTIVASPLDVPSSQGSNATGTVVDRIWEPTSCILGVLISILCAASGTVIPSRRTTLGSRCTP